MKKDKNHIDPNWEFSIEKMQAYVNGTLRPEEQHQVEKYLLSHPFEAEAMEGYLENPEALHDLPSLKANLQARTTPKQEQRTIPFWRKALPFAAVFLLLIISSVLIIMCFQQDESFTPLAIKSEEAIKFDDYENPANPPIPVQDESREKESENLPKAMVKSNDSESKQEIELPIKTVEDAERIAQKESISIEEDLIVSETAVPYEDSFQEFNKDSMAGKVAEIETDQNKSSVARSKKANELASSIAPTNEQTDQGDKRKVAVSQRISGEVLDAETGEAIPGANVILKGTSIGTSTDLDGSFEIAANLNDVLIVNFIGMEQQEFVVSKEAENKIFLNTDVAQLSEVVVTSIGQEKEEDNTYSGARPRMGFSDYRDYLKDNLRYPPKALEAGTEGKVRLKLSISATGSITEVEVIRGLGDGCDEEAIRLIMEGPKWEPAKRGDTPMESSKKISVRFKIN
ncbi:TonB family protein [Marivirga salinae]|uniref:TonB family protein n=1 Tax=Marivirga salinarum TaxID=3059078 RepID=A0AA51NE33_9BACT|nr:TonB family protein [Marivirga sp. BDSF4-3]WMN12266.1 TonB family protein [Marivirga sp. BDSF4-3]